MSVLLLVRHGQASFLEDDYDRLSTTGEEQGRALGRYWAQQGLVFDQVYVGPRLRQRQTCEAVAETYRARGVSWPEAIPLPELDEHHGQRVLEEALPRLAEREGSAFDLAERYQAGDPQARREYLEVFQRVTRMWARGELDVASEAEPWAVFRNRVRAGLESIVQRAGGGKTVAAFTSGGVIAAAVGLALDVGDEKIVELSWTVRNAAYTEFLFSGQRFSLSAFNVATHLGAAHHTFV